MPLNFFYYFNAIVCISTFLAQAQICQKKRNRTCTCEHKSGFSIKYITSYYMLYFITLATVLVPSVKVVTTTFTPSKGLLLSTPARL